MALLDGVFVPVHPDTDKFEPDLKRKLARVDASKSGKQVATRFGVGFNGAIGGIVSRSAGIFAAGFAVVKGAQIFGGFINDARESAKVARVSAQVIKSTGGAAKISAAQMGDLATAISNKTGADDEAIQSGENLLATFTNVRNEVGKGNDIFNRASQAAVDMASAMNNGVVDANGLKAANIQLGKALNDPIKGVSALSKVGVSFTQGQKDQIKTLVESGHTLAAQKIILAEVGKEFGGAAAAASDPLTRLKTIAGNVAESIGGVFLPVVDRAANWLGTRLPQAFDFVHTAAQAVFDTFKNGAGSGYLDAFGVRTGKVLTAIGVAARQAFDIFRDEVLPRLKEFGNFVTGSVVPALISMATFVAKNKDFFVPFAATIGAIIAAVKVWTIVQTALDVVLAANPIGLVVIGLAALVGGLVYAYRHSETFRKIVKGALDAVKTAIDAVKATVQIFAPAFKAYFDIVIGVISVWWNYYAKPMLTAFKYALQSVWQQAQTFARVLSAAWGAIKEPARIAIKYVIDHFLNMVDTVLKGAAKAFGWVPGLGDKLKDAAKDFGKFRDNVNHALDGIDDESIKVALSYSAKGVNLTAPSSVGRRAMGGPGGPVRGPGTATSDEAGLFRLSNKEWVIKAESSMKYGDYAMASVNAGTATIIPGGLAAGGRAGLNVRDAIPAEGPINYTAKVIAKRFGQAIGKEIGASGGPPGAVSRFRGELLNARTIRMLLSAEKILGHVFRIMQGSYSTRVAASGGTHSGGGAMDTDGPGGWNAAVRALRGVGFAAWHRTPAQGPWGHHIHSIAIGDPTASPSAKAQVRSFLRGGSGLGMWRGGPVSFDRGGWLMPGLTLAHNGTGVPERVGGGPTIQFTNCTFAGTSKAQFTDLVVGAVDEAKRKRRI